METLLVTQWVMHSLMAPFLPNHAAVPVHRVQFPRFPFSFGPRIGGANCAEDRLDFVVLPFRCSFQHGLHGIPDGQVGARMWWKGNGFTEFKVVKWFGFELTLSEVILELISIWEKFRFDLGYDLSQLYLISWTEGYVTCKVCYLTGKMFGCHSQGVQV